MLRSCGNPVRRGHRTGFFIAVSKSLPANRNEVAARPACSVMRLRSWRQPRLQARYRLSWRPGAFKISYWSTRPTKPHTVHSKSEGCSRGGDPKG